MVNKDEYWVKVNRLAEYQGQRSFRARGIVRTHTHIQHTDWAGRATKLVGNE